MVFRCIGGRISGRCCLPGKQKTDKVVIPLLGASASVRIVDFTAEVTIKQRYENQEKDPIEAVYDFPLDPRASVSNFYAEIDNKKIVGTIKEKESAKDTYDDAIASGHGAYLLEEKDDKPNIFTTSVGNLPPGKEVLIVIVYVTELDFEDDKLQFVLPANPYPYDGKTVSKFVLPKNKDTLYSKEVPYGLSVGIELDMTSPIKSIATTTHHEISYEKPEPNKAIIKLANQEEGVPLGHDFKLTVGFENPHQPCLRIEEDDNGERAVMLSIYPDLKDDSQVFTEMIFLIDRSGSMAGSGINRVKNTLQIFLRSLPEGTLFNIIGFGSNFEKLFTGSVEYNEKNLEIATKYVEGLKANMGGTNIIKPLVAIFEEKPNEGIPRQLFILTDGAVENPQLCIDTVRRHANTTRVFTFGIGSDVDQDLVYGMAKQGEGKAEIILGDDNMDEKVLRQLNHALKPALTELKLDWGIQGIQQTPFYFPPLFGGGRLISYALLPKGVNPGTITLTAKIVDNQHKIEIPPTNANVLKSSSSVHKLAARSMIRDLEENRSCLHNDKGELIDKNKNIKNEIIRLSTRYNVISKYTAFVAVEKRVDAVEGEMKLRKMDINEFSTKSQNRPGLGLNQLPTTGYAARTRSAGRGGLSNSVKKKSAIPPPVSSPSPSPSPSPSVMYGRRLDKSKSKEESSGSSLWQKFTRSRSEAAPAKRKMMAKDMSSVSYSSPIPDAKEEVIQECCSSSEEDEMDDNDDLMELEDSFAPPPPSSAPQQEKMKISATPLPLPSSPSPTPSSSVNLTDIIKKQRANGSFSTEALKMISPSSNLSDIHKEVSNAVPGNTNIDKLADLLITAILCNFIESRFANQKVTWSLIVKKAWSWVKKESDSIGLQVDWNSIGKVVLDKLSLK